MPRHAKTSEENTEGRYTAKYATMDVAAYVAHKRLSSRSRAAKNVLLFCPAVVPEEGRNACAENLSLRYANQRAHMQKAVVTK